MKRFRVTIAGENFLLDVDGESGKFAFTAARLVKANSPQDAERIALIRIHHELNQSGHVVKNTCVAPRVFVESIEELKFFQFMSKKGCNNLEFRSDELHG